MEDKQYAHQWRKAAHQPVGLIGRSRQYLRHVSLSLLSAVNPVPKENFLRALFTHNVFDDQIEEFETIILELKKIGTFVNTETMVEMLEGKREIDKKYFHLSFDDGFRNIYTNAYPILRKHEIPALFFIPSALVGADWSRTYNYCKSVTHYTGTIELINWQELRIMAKSGVEVGSHTRNHACFAEISSDLNVLKDEIVNSKFEIENELGIECKYISWPYGVKNAADDLSLITACTAGYQACFGGYRGSIKPGETDRYSIPRHYFETNWPLNHVTLFAKGFNE